MAFIIDKQTINDLKIFGKVRGNSIYSLFNITRTHGGSDILEEMFRYPLSDLDKINERTQIIKFFIDNNLKFDFSSEWFDQIEHYLSNVDERTKLHKRENTLRRKFNNLIGADVSYKQINKGVVASAELIYALNRFVIEMESSGMLNVNSSYYSEVQYIKDLLKDDVFAWATGSCKKKISYLLTVEYDNQLRFNGIEKFRKLLRFVYNIDVYAAIAGVAEKYNFTFATALPSEAHILKINGLRHPLIENAIPNTIELSGNENVVFLTGANMAGKSTFMKSFGIAVYLAHIGFPIPADSMEFSVQNGMYTTINLPDNMNQGFSHFYAEVQRLKRVSELVGKTGNIIIVFDELFRGTNVKDAHEATVEIVKAFSKKDNCLFMISTHIIEAGEDLMKCCNNIKYIYLPTIMKDGMPSYTYKLSEGITSDRHGMMIVKNEKIMETLKL